VEISSALEAMIQLLIFILGLGFGAFGKWFNQKNETNQLIEILSHEIKYNFELLSMSSSALSSEDAGSKAKFLARTSEALSTAVFDTYISKIDRLKSTQITLAFQYYMLLKQLTSHGKEFIELINKDERSARESNAISARGAAITLQVSKLLSGSQDVLKSLGSKHELPATDSKINLAQNP